tara:strand:+ start:826 stop:1968 length:1143 start_codon:yes stop_codon:yes gene_type:complete
MTPEELHEYLLGLKNKNSQDPNIAQYKANIRKELEEYRSNPCENYSLHTKSSLHHKWNEEMSTPKDVVFYSFMEPEDKPKISEHEYKRLKLSWSSIREHNTEVEIRFCYRKNYAWAPAKAITEQNKWQSLCDDFGVEMYPFHESFTGNEPNAWCIHRWYNLALWKDESLNVLYLDADTYINGDIQQIFNIYRRDPIYGREELGFRHDPNFGVCGEDPRFYLDLVDASIVAQGGKTEVQKYCLGVILLNHSIHKLFTSEILKDFTDLLERIHKFKVFYSIPNYRIMDEFAFWVLLSRWGLRTSLFGDQDVSQTFLEKKHEAHFNPLILHYTTKDEEKFADWAPEFFCLSRSNEDREDSDLAAGGIYNVSPMMREELAMSMW